MICTNTTTLAIDMQRSKYSTIGRNIRNSRLLMFHMLSSFTIHLGGGGGLGEVRGHELLEVEVGELLVLLQVQQARELAVSLDDTTVAGVLELVGANVGVDLLSDLSTSHLSTLGLAKERGESVADLGGLDEATGLAVAGGRAGTLAASLLGLLNLARGTLLKLTHLSLDGGKSGADLLDVGK